MLRRLTTTLSTNVAIAGLIMVALGAGGGATLAASSPNPKPDTSHADQDDANEANDESTEAPESQDAEDQGTRPTDTHGFCVSQVAKAAPTAPTGEGADKVTHGSLVSAAAHACGKENKQAGAASKQAHGKAFGKNHGTGRPAAVTPHTPAG